MFEGAIIWPLQSLNQLQICKLILKNGFKEFFKGQLIHLLIELFIINADILFADKVFSFEKTVEEAIRNLFFFIQGSCFMTEVFDDAFRLVFEREPGQVYFLIVED